jgi:tetratricopeptide (TPR) repeat protein
MSPVGPITSSILCSWLYDILTKSVKLATKEENPVLAKAIILTCEQFKGIEGLKQAITSFLKDAKVVQEISNLSQGGNDIDVTNLGNILLEKTHFHMGEQTDDYSKKLLTALFDNLYREFVKTNEYGHWILLKRADDNHTVEMQDGHQVTQNMVGELSEKLESLNKSIGLNTYADVHSEGKIEGIFKERIDEARDLITSGKVKTAKEIYKGIIASLEKNKDVNKHLCFRAYNNLASCELQIGEEKEAATHFLKAYEYAPDDIKSNTNAGLAYLLEDNKEEALKYVNKALTINANYVDALCLKATILYEVGEKKQAIDVLEGQEISQCYITLADIYLRDANFDKAIALSRKSIENDKANINNRMILGISLIRKAEKQIKEKAIMPSQSSPEVYDLLNEAKDTFTSLIDDVSSQELDRTLLSALCNRGVAFTLMGDYKNSIADERRAFYIDPHSQSSLNNMAIAEFLSNNYSAASNIFEKLTKIDSENEDYLFKLANAYILNGKPEKAKELLEGKTSLGMKLLYVNALIRNQELKKAEEILQELSQKHQDNIDVLLTYAHYFSEVGNLDESIKKLKTAYENGSDVQKRIAAASLAGNYFDKKEYKKAADIYEDYMTPKIDNSFLRNYVRCLYDLKAYKECLLIIKAHKEENDPDAFYLEVEASIYEFLGQLQNAYDTYAKLYKKLPKASKYLARQAVCLFRLGKEKESFDFLNSVKDRFEDAEEIMILAETFDFVGNTVEAIEQAYKALKMKFSGPRVHLVYIRLFMKLTDEKIEDKYIKEYQDCLANFNSRFPNEKAFQKIKVSDDLKEIFELVDKRAKKAENIKQQFKEKKLPFYSLSFLMGVDLFTVWGVLVASPDLRLTVAHGSSNEQRDEISLADSSDEIVLDIFSLFTFAHLNLLEELEKAFAKILISQSVLDGIMQTISSFQIGSKQGQTTLSKEEGKYVRQEIPAEYINKKIEFLDKMKDFAASKVIGIGRQYNEMEEKLAKAITEEAIEALILSQTNKIPLCSDDRAFIDFGKTEYKISGFCSTYVLSKMLKNKLISDEQYYEKILDLIQLTYNYIPIKAEMVVHFLKKANYKIDENVSILLGIIKSGDTDENSAIALVATIISTIWLDFTLQQDKVNILCALLSSLTAQRNTVAVCAKLQNILKRKLALLPLHLYEIQKLMKQWNKAQIILP